jgi:hypothetical protein
VQGRTVEFTVHTVWDQGGAPPGYTWYFGDGQSATSGAVPGQLTRTFCDSQGHVEESYSFVVQHTYPTDGPFVAYMGGCCRHAGGTNFLQSSSYRLEAGIDLSDGNQGSPTAELPALLSVPSAARTLLFPLNAADPDLPLACQNVQDASVGILGTPSWLAHTSGALELRTGPPRWTSEQAAIHLRIFDSLGAYSSYDLLVEFGCPDDDDDGAFASCLPGTPPICLDCDDSNGDVHPGATEVCDGLDTDCDGLADNLDNDGDGYAPVSCGGSDCDDEDPEAFPGNNEICDHRDNNCDGRVDEGFTYVEGYPDNDQDGIGAGASRLDCPGVVSPLDGDCDDHNSDNFPGNGEICDHADNNCDGRVDEGFTYVSRYPDNDQDGYGAGPAELMCAAAGSMNVDDCDDSDPNNFPGNPEICDGRDNDCDAAVDEELSADLDGDGHYDLGSCEVPADDCDDGDDQIHPGHAESCDGIDNDCNGAIDEGLSTDADKDGHYAPGSCLQPQDDCDDTHAFVFPGAPELCDGIDNDCDDELPADEKDLDFDGYRACAECDDTDRTTYPAAPEDPCEPVDRNCDGLVPDGSRCESYLDPGCACAKARSEHPSGAGLLVLLPLMMLARRRGQSGMQRGCPPRNAPFSQFL